MAPILDFKIVSQEVYQNGRSVILLADVQGKRILLVNSYAPNDEVGQVSFFKEFYDKIRIIKEDHQNVNIIWGGDFNFSYSGVQF